eukprot:m.111624 g.111624  ORF g.111624 m.111624 type:complete len:1457 (+) comp9094_c0_seq1:188-4558(+)
MAHPAAAPPTPGSPQPRSDSLMLPPHDPLAGCMGRSADEPIISSDIYLASHEIRASAVHPAPHTCEVSSEPESLIISSPQSLSPPSFDTGCGRAILNAHRRQRTMPGPALLEDAVRAHMPDVWSELDHDRRCSADQPAREWASENVTREPLTGLVMAARRHGAALAVDADIDALAATLHAALQDVLTYSYSELHLNIQNPPLCAEQEIVPTTATLRAWLAHRCPKISEPGPLRQTSLLCPEQFAQSDDLVAISLDDCSFSGQTAEGLLKDFIVPTREASSDSQSHTSGVASNPESDIRACTTSTLVTGPKFLKLEEMPCPAPRDCRAFFCVRRLPGARPQGWAGFGPATPSTDPVCAQGAAGADTVASKKTAGACEGIQPQRIAVLVPFYNETPVSLQRTLMSLSRAIDDMRDHLIARGQQPPEVNVFLVQDGWRMTHPTMIDYLEALFPPAHCDRDWKSLLTLIRAEVDPSRYAGENLIIQPSDQLNGTVNVALRWQLGPEEKTVALSVSTVCAAQAAASALLEMLIAWRDKNRAASIDQQLIDAIEACTAAGLAAVEVARSAQCVHSKSDDLPGGGSVKNPDLTGSHHAAASLAAAEAALSDARAAAEGRLLVKRLSTDVGSWREPDHDDDQGVVSDIARESTPSPPPPPTSHASVDLLLLACVSKALSSVANSTFAAVNAACATSPGPAENLSPTASAMVRLNQELLEAINTLLLDLRSGEARAHTSRLRRLSQTALDKTDDMLQQLTACARFAARAAEEWQDRMPPQVQHNLNVTLFVKFDNRKKHNSHEWFLRAMAAEVDASHVFLTDCSTLYEKTLLRRLFEAIEADPKLAAVTGRQRVMTYRMQEHTPLDPDGREVLLEERYPYWSPANLLDESPMKFWLRQVQRFDFESAFEAYMGAFSSAGILPVIPGPCGLYRYRTLSTPSVAATYLVKEVNGHLDPAKISPSWSQILCGRPQLGTFDEVAHSPLDWYFEIICKAVPSLVLSNLQIAEDRILSYASVVAAAEPNLRQTVVPGAVFFFEGETDLESLMKQRRRWINGTWAGYLYLLLQSRALNIAPISAGRRIAVWILFSFQALMFVSVALSQCVFLLALLASEHVLLGSQTSSGADTVVIFCAAAALYITLVYRSLSRTFDRVTIFLSLVVNTVIVLLTFAAFMQLVAEDRLALLDAPVDGVLTTGQLAIMSFAVILLPLITSLFHDWRSTYHMLTAALPFLLFQPSLVAMFGSYSFARMHDVSWGNRPAEVAHGTPNQLRKRSHIISMGIVALNIGIAVFVNSFNRSWIFIFVLSMLMLMFGVLQLPLSVAFFAWNDIKIVSNRIVQLLRRCCSCCGSADARKTMSARESTLALSLAESGCAPSSRLPSSGEQAAILACEPQWRHVPINPRAIENTDSPDRTVPYWSARVPSHLEAAGIWSPGPSDDLTMGTKRWSLPRDSLIINREFEDGESPV